MLVLIVDDDHEDREIFCEAMQSIDRAIKCISANNGVEALEYLNQHEFLPDFIFLDVNMPKMNGKECLTLIKANSNFNYTTVVMYSTAESPAEILLYKKMNTIFLQKPSSIEELIRALRKIIKSRMAEGRL